MPVPRTGTRSGTQAHACAPNGVRRGRDGSSALCPLRRVVSRMARSASVHVCSACGHEEPRWHGRCPGCGEWNTLVEEVRERAGRVSLAASAARKPVALASHAHAPGAPRLETGIGELDRVLGGGVVPGSVVLIGGAPGIGKSTLMNMALGNLAACRSS